MQRKTFRRLRSKDHDDFHHHVYVIELSAEAKKYPRVQKANPNSDPARPCVYVGMSGLSPEQRFENHKRGLKASGWVHRFGVRLLPELYEHLNPMPYEAALQMERELADDLRAQGYAVVGGH